MANIPAFTIIEAVISMIITAIILSVIFVIFSVASQRLSDFRLQNEYISDLNRFTYSINKLLFESEKFTLSDNALVFTSYIGDTVRYRAANDFLIRNSNEFNDTFKIKVNEVYIDTVRNKSGKKIYHRLNYTINSNAEAITLKFYKSLYPAQLINTK